MASPSAERPDDTAQDEMAQDDTAPASQPMPTPDAARRPAAAQDAPRREVKRRGFFEVRWRQFRNAPRPVVRAVASSLTVAIVLGVLFEAYDIALDRGARLPGGDLRIGVLTLYVLLVALFGALITWLIVPLPGGAAQRRTTRTPWSAMLGLFAAVPIAYLVLVALHEILKPILVSG